MKVFYATSFSGRQKYQRNYDLILGNIEQHEVEVVSIEKGNYKNTLSLREKQLLGDEKKIHYEAIHRGIIYSDAVILEMSQEDFQMGYEATMAFQSKKHVLCLSIFDDFSEKIADRYFHGARYNEFTIDEIIDDFLAKIQKDFLTERFNCFLSKMQFDYLQKSADDRHMNMSEYLRFLIDEQIRK